MNGKKIAYAFSMICLLSLFTYSQQNQFVRDIFSSKQDIFDVKRELFGFESLKPQPNYLTLQITEEIAYERLLRLIASFEKQSDKQIKEGQVKRAEFLRSYLQRKTGLTLEQAKTLKNYAKSYTSELGCIANRTKFDTRTENNPANFIDERGRKLSEYRQRIRQMLGETAFAEFDKFVREKIASRITYGRNSNTQTAFFGFSMVDYDYQADEVLGYSYTDEPSGHCQVVTNIVTATLSSDAEGQVGSDSAEVCDGGAEVYMYFSNPQPEDRFCVDGEHQYAITYYPQLNDGMFGFSNNSAQKSNLGSCYYEKTNSMPPSEDCLSTPPLPNVTSVTFQLIQTGSTGIDTNPNAEGGQRIFPDDDTPFDTVNRQQIRVTGRLGENRAGVTIYFRNFDLDDPSTDMTIDTNGNSGDDNNGEVSGSRAGQLSAVSAVTNNNGEASVTFTVTKQPGDNFAIAAGTSQTQVSDVTVNGTALVNGSGASIDTNCDGTEQVCRSEMLTVWRRLHIEVDSMGLATQNFVRGTITDTRKIGTGTQTLNLSVNNLDPNRFENGRLVIEGSSTRSFQIIDATFDPLTGMVINSSNSNSSVTFRNNGPVFSVANGTPFILYDDDDMDNDDSVLNGDDGDNVPRPDTSLLEDSDTLCSDTFNANNCNVFANAYIRPRFDIGQTDLNSFNANADNGLIQSYRNLYFQNRLTQANEEFWTVYLLGAYQFTETQDGDPDEFGGVFGIVDALLGAGEGATVFTELARAYEFKLVPTWQTRPVGMRFTVAHEIGHLFDGRHEDYDINSDAGLMAQTGIRTSPIFNSVTINKIRGGEYIDDTGTTRRITHP